MVSMATIMLIVLVGCTGSAVDDSGVDASGACPAGQIELELACNELLFAGCHTPCTLGSSSCAATESCRSECGEPVACLPLVPYPLSSLDDRCDGIAGRDVVDAVDETNTAMLTYDEGETELTLTLRYGAGAITCLPRNAFSVGNRPGVRVQVDATIVTADGAFDEAIDTVLTVREGEPVVPLSIALLVESLRGAYVPRGEDVNLVILVGRVDRGSFAGTVSEQDTRGMTLTVGSW